MNSESISVRYPSLIFSIYLVIAAILSLINGQLYKRAELQRMKETYDHYKISHQETIIKDLWLTDYKSVQKQIDFLKQSDYIDYLEVLDDEGSLYTSGEYNEKLIQSYTSELHYHYKEKKVPVGTIKYYINTSRMDYQVRIEFLKQFLMLTTSALILAGISSLLFNLMAGKHIKSLSSYLTRERLAFLEKPFILKRRRVIKDELHDLSQSANNIRKEIKDYITNEENIRRNMEEEAKFRNKLLSIMSHDLRGPLGSYSQLAESLLENMPENSSTDSENRQLVVEMQKSSQSLWLLTENLLDWAKCHNMENALNKESISICWIMEEVSNLLFSIISQKGIDFQFQCKEDINCLSDKRMTSAILRNIISNAIKFTPKGGNIRVSVSKNENTAEIIVQDSGKGMAEETLNAFQKRMEIPSTLGTENENGVGLGLKLCRDFIDLNNGRISLENSPEGGLKVNIKLPLVSTETRQINRLQP